jgi:hypothetical protein
MTKLIVGSSLCRELASMFRRPLWLTVVLAAAVVLPYITLDDQLAQTVQGQYQRLTSAKPASDDRLAAIEQATEATATALTGGKAVQPPAPATVPLAEAIRFDVTPEWVTGRWPRVSTVTGEASQLGLRVPLVSGTEATDVAGSLTYYFDQKHELQRITLLGVTGDEAQLVQLAVGKFGLRPTQTPDRGLYYGGDVNEPTSSLRVSHLPVISAAAPNARLQVALDLKRADVAKITPESAQPGKILPTNYRRW